MRRELVIAAGPGEWRAALLEGGVAVELRVERGDGAEAGSIHLGRVLRLLPALGAALVDIGGDRPGFLPHSELLPRGRRLDEGERVVVQVRREAQGGKAARLTTDIKSSSRPLELICDCAARSDPPTRLDPAAGFATALAGVLPMPDRLVIDEPGAIPELRAAFPVAEIAHQPEGDWPVDLGALLDEALSPTLALAGGGSVHFEATRAATMIDVDSGTPETGSPERGALAVDLAAALLIARQARLRNLGGGIVVDFIGLDDRRARERVRAALAGALAADPARPQLLGWTRLGHFELVRPRRTRPLAETLLEPGATGAQVKSALTVALEALRAVRREDRAQPGRRWQLIAAPEVAAALAGDGATARRGLEQRLGREIAITADPQHDRAGFEIFPV
ncbi:MAG TPA: ribonuclease E/G [Stellaceae bacterium]|jgi:Ribonuclease G/E